MNESELREKVASLELQLSQERESHKRDERMADQIISERRKEIEQLTAELQEAWQEIKYLSRDLKYQEQVARQRLDNAALKFEDIRLQNEQLIKVIADRRALLPPPPIIIQREAALETSLQSAREALTQIAESYCQFSCSRIAENALSSLRDK